MTFPGRATLSSSPLMGAQGVDRYDDTLLEPDELWSQAPDVLFALATIDVTPTAKPVVNCHARCWGKQLPE